jgi:hypothetical protein
VFAGQRRGRKAAYKPQVEALEQREVLSVFLTGGPIGGNAGTSTSTDPGVTLVEAPDPGVTLIQKAFQSGGVKGETTGTFDPAGPEPTAAGLALINGLPDTPVRTAALADYQRDGRITRNDMIDILFHGTTGFTDLTNAELASLRTLVANGPTVGMPEYVQNLASKALAGTPNAPALKLNVDNFFLGLNRPDPLPYSNYYPVHAPLWNGVPSPKDIHQEAGVFFEPVDGDSSVQIGFADSHNWLLTSLEEVVSRRRASIMSMFIDNGDNTYTVRFYHNGTPDYVTVDNYLNSASDVRGEGGDRGVLWPSLIVKAYAQENAAGWIGSPHPGGTNYDAILVAETSADGPHDVVGDPTWAFPAITGMPGTTSASLDRDAIGAAWSRGDFVLLHTGTDFTADGLLKTDRPSDLLNPRGWYALVNYVPDASVGGRFTITQNGTRFLEAEGRVLADNFNSWVDSAAPGAAVAQTGSGDAGTFGTTLGVIGIDLSRPAPRPESVLLQTRGRGKTRKLVAVVKFATGPAREIVSPFQKPQVRAVLQDLNGDGIPDSVLFTALRGKKKVSRTVML